MFKKIFLQKDKGVKKSKRNINLLQLELLEVNEIANILFKRLEEKIETLKALEKSANEKIAALKVLIQQAELAKSNFNKYIDRRDEVIYLSETGLNTNEIADKLGMPVGEIELILNLNK
ncbi:MAG: hypothetical protein QXP45_02895 [Thermoproteota archaeon]